MIANMCETKLNLIASLWFIWSGVESGWCRWIGSWLKITWNDFYQAGQPGFGCKRHLNCCGQNLSNSSASFVLCCEHVIRSSICYALIKVQGYLSIASRQWNCSYSISFKLSFTFFLNLWLYHLCSGTHQHVQQKYSCRAFFPKTLRHHVIGPWLSASSVARNPLTILWITKYCFTYSDN